MLIGPDARYDFRKQRRGIGIYIYNLPEEFGNTDGPTMYCLWTGCRTRLLLKVFPGYPLLSAGSSWRFCIGDYLGSLEPDIDIIFAFRKGRREIAQKTLLVIGGVNL